MGRIYDFASLHLCPLKVSIHMEGQQDSESSLPQVALLIGQEGLAPTPEVFPLRFSVSYGAELFTNTLRHSVSQ